MSGTNGLENIPLIVSLVAGLEIRRLRRKNKKLALIYCYGETCVILLYQVSSFCIVFVATGV